MRKMIYALKALVMKFCTSDMKVLVGGIKKDLYDRFDLQQLLSDNRLLDEQIVEDVLKITR